MIIEMRDTVNPQYGDVAKSVANFYITGRGVHSRHHPHELIRWDFTHTRTGFPEENGLHFSARDIVISATPRQRPPMYDVKIGDTVTVDGEDYFIAPRWLDDPTLVPLSGFYAVDVLDETQARLLTRPHEIAEATGRTGLPPGHRISRHTVYLPGALVDALRELPDDRDGVVGEGPTAGELVIWFGGEAYPLRSLQAGT